MFTIVLILQAGLLRIDNAPLSVQEMAVKDLEKLGEYWFAFEQAWKDQDENCYGRFNQLRQLYRSVEFLLPLIHSEEEIESLNNSKLWVWQDSIFQRQHIEIGSFQFLEKVMLGSPDLAGNAELHLTRCRRIINNLPSRFRDAGVSDTDFLFAIVMDQYRQYFLTLSAYDRLDTKEIITEYRQALHNHYQYLKLLDLSLPETQLGQSLKAFKRISQSLEGIEFRELRRLSLLRKDLQPLLATLSKKARLLSKNRIPAWAQALQWNGASPFSANWLNPSHFIKNRDTTAYATKVATGKLLFFDPILSSNNKRTCASCHKPQKAFTDGRMTSQGFDFSAKLPRNAPSLVNTVFNQEYGHDGRFPSLQDQILSVIYNHQEFRSSLPEITQKLATSSEYQQLFARCFPRAEAVIDSNQILEVLAAYTASLISFSSPVDLYMQGAQRDLEASVVQGYDLFMGEAMCGSCHFAPLFSGLKPPIYNQQEYHSHGVDLDFRLSPGQAPDLGRAGVQLPERAKTSYAYHFKTPSLRNLPQSAPYLHHGAYNSLSDFIDFMRAGKTPSEYAGTFPPGSIQLKPEEYESLLDFLHALDDRSLIQNHHERLQLPRTDDSLAPAVRRAAGVY